MLNKNHESKIMPTLKDTSFHKSRSIRWDAHGCPLFTIGADLSFLSRYKNSSVNFVSLNVGFDLTNQTETLEVINYFHQWISKHNDEYTIIKNIEQIYESRS